MQIFLAPAGTEPPFVQPVATGGSVDDYTKTSND